MYRKLVRLFVLVCLCVVLGATTGCTYARHRVEDGLEVVDVGLTFTAKPSIGLYWNSLDIFPVGYSHIDGWFLGWGGGQIGVTRHYNHCWGLGYGKEVIGWGDFDVNRPETLRTDYSGVLGILLPPYVNDPGYTPACVHFFPHILIVGLVWNARWYEMADFAVGFTTIDLSGDDGVEIGHWPWQTEPQWRGDEPAETAMAAEG